MHRRLTNPKLYFMLVADGVLFVLSICLAYALRFDFDIPPRFELQLRYLLPLVIVFKSLSFLAFGLYRGMWRYTDLRDSWRLLQASLLSSLAVIAVVAYWARFQGYSRSIFAMDFAFTFLMCGGLRAGIRTAYRRHHAGLGFPWLRRKRGGAQHRDLRKRTVIVGAGYAGEKLLREIVENPGLGLQVVGFLDDNPGKRHRSIHGVPVLGTVDDMDRVLGSAAPVHQVFIAIPSATGRQVRRIVSHCEKCSVEYKILPDLSRIIDGKVSVGLLRDVSYEDLLGREPVRLDTDMIQEVLRDRRVLVTGAGGSIGSELCRQIIRYAPDELILLDHSEANLYAVEMELRHAYGFSSFTSILGSIQDSGQIDALFARHRPQTVFHAAAYKHVPMLEDHPWEAVINNIIGTRTVMEAAATHHSGRFVLVSTDKAVHPTSVMGATKRVTEILMQCSPRNGDTRFMAVRFGNVLGSSGSVLPLFKRQVELGGPVTVTHPEVTRYFMTIGEACQLIIQASAMGRGGEIFVLDMGTPVKIADMAADLIRLCGKEPGRDIEITYVGLRPGEKLYEELSSERDDMTPTDHLKIMVLKNAACSHMGGGPSDAKDWLTARLEELGHQALRRDGKAIREVLRQIVPEYTPFGSGD